MMTIDLRNRCGWLLPIGAVLGLALLWGMVKWDSRVQFLQGGGAAWIVYPSPFNGETIPAATLPANFHRSFVLERKPAEATLEWRCFRRGEVLINRQLVASEQNGNWKQFARVDVAPLLREGTNEIEVNAEAATGPPAISVRLRAGGLTLVTDDEWDVLYAGALRLPARLAADEPDNVPGNDVSGRTAAALGRVWGYEGLFVVMALLAAFGLRRFGNARAVAAILAVGWIVLLAHNLSLMRFCLGFDATGHVNYIKFIEETGTLPRANQGWEMFQPPFYYLIGAGLLRVAGAGAYTETAMLLLRGFNFVAGAANVALIFWGMRMVFPGQVKKQVAGAALAAFVPCQIYLWHYTTNEVLMATLGTASLCFGLKCLQAEPLSLWWRVGLGVVLGGACATKASAFALLPMVFAALGARLLGRKERAVGVWLRDLALPAVLTVVVGGWRYWALARQYGSPLAGLWNPGGRQPWWQQAGYFTTGYFLSFGRSLSAPYFSGFHSFWDCLYTTFWGDGLLGGQLQFGRSPWNTDFMAVGYWLALPLTGLIVTGAIMAALSWMRQPRAEGLMIVGIAATYFFALALVTLKLPSYSQAKAFYALPALLPLCIFAVEGWGFWAKRGEAILCAAVTLWLVNNYAAFWIQGDSTQFRLCRATANYHVATADAAAADFQSVLGVDPHNAVAQLYAALLDREAGRMDQFAADLKRARTDHPDDADICALEADDQAHKGNWNAALPLAEWAARLAPDDYAPALSWMRFARGNHRDAEVVAAGELVLRDRPGLMEAHRAMAEALTKLGKPDLAAVHANIVAGNAGPGDAR